MRRSFDPENRGVEAEEGHGGGKVNRGLEGDVDADAVGWSLGLGCASYPTSKPHLSIDSFFRC